jgi:hypothetical protein
MLRGDGTRATIVISGGFFETGACGAALERATLENVRRHGVHLLGQTAWASSVRLPPFAWCPNRGRCTLYSGMLVEKTAAGLEILVVAGW